MSPLIWLIPAGRALAPQVNRLLGRGVCSRRVGLRGRDWVQGGLRRRDGGGRLQTNALRDGV
jgi:hypothetical protein